MARLYFRIYLAVIGSIVLFALLAAIAWRFRPDEGRFGPRPSCWRRSPSRSLLRRSSRRPNRG